jgi:hypothetical protein
MMQNTHIFSIPFSSSPSSALNAGRDPRSFTKMVVTRGADLEHRRLPGSEGRLSGVEAGTNARES